MRKYFFLFLLILCFSFSAIFATEIKKTYEKRFDIQPGGQVTVEADEGDIRVNSWDKAEVEVFWTKKVRGKNTEEAEKRLDLAKVHINKVGNRLIIKVVKSKSDRSFNFWDIFDPDTWNNFSRTPVISIEIKVPKRINLSLSVDEGDVFVDNVEGNIDIESDEGDIDIYSIKFRQLDLTSDEGDISGSDLINSDGRIYIEVDEGDVTLKNVQTGRLSFECDEGDAQFENLICEKGYFLADEGNIELGIAELNENDRYQISTDEGDFIIYLPGDPNVTLDLESNDGRIRSDFPVKIDKKDDWQRCQDTLGDGSALIKAYTDEGHISLRKF